MAKTGINWKLIAVILWAVMVCGMAAWWMSFGMSVVTRLTEFGGESFSELVRHRNMLIWEGGTWMLLLVSGAVTLVQLVHREKKQAEELRAFTAAFSHDLKTSLASLRLQGESLLEDITDPEMQPYVKRIVSDTVRLEVQLENSLYLASGKDNQFFIETVSLRELVNFLSYHWPNLKISISEDCFIRGDRRALESIFKNLFQNSVVHGGATEVSLKTTQKKSQLILHYADNGTGFHGDWEELSRLFYRHNPSSGSGLGLYIIHNLLRDMKGKMKFLKGKSPGFHLDISLPLESQ